jgi:SAM-dependent methyltransferase
MSVVYEKILNAFGVRRLAAPANAGDLLWQCNICGALNSSPAKHMDREGGPCSQCASNMRFRCVAAVLTMRLFGRIAILADLPINKALVGAGMSDADCYADWLKTKFEYQNTFYHAEPYLDIMHPQQHWLGRHDFIISSDVFEHVPPPVQTAFDNLKELLKPGGVAVFSVPFTLAPRTTEHYPNLHDYAVRQEGAEWVLENQTADGKREVFRNLVFHGGPGSTLEMRVFSLAALQEHFARSGFEDVRIHDEAFFEHGIFWMHPWSLVISAVRPR